METIKLKNHTITITRDAEISQMCNEDAVYIGLGVDESGKEVEITWEIVCPDNDGDESIACDWSKPTKVIYCDDVGLSSAINLVEQE